MAVFDVVVAGGGVNGLACAAMLAREGLSVCVVERNPWVGGGAVTREVTLPGFKHDLYGSSHVWIQCNADFKALQPELERYGLKYLYPDDHITGHPDKSGGPGIIIYKSIDKTCESIAWYSRADAARYRKVYDDFALVKDGSLQRLEHTASEFLRLSGRARNDFVKELIANENEDELFNFGAFLEALQSPTSIGFHVIALGFAIYHSVTWFNLTPKALPLQIGEAFVPDAAIAGAHFAAWAVLTAAVLYLAGAF